MVGACEDCHKRFEYTLIHNGVNSSSYAYCERCGTVAILDLSDSRFPVESLKKSAYQVIAPGVEEHLKPCSCGGKFSAKGAPHCPFCQQPLSAVKAAQYIEQKAVVLVALDNPFTDPVAEGFLVFSSTDRL